MSGIYRYSDKINDCVRLFPGQYPNNVKIIIDQPENHNFNFVPICTNISRQSIIYSYLLAIIFNLVQVLWKILHVWKIEPSKHALKIQFLVDPVIEARYTVKMYHNGISAVIEDVCECKLSRLHVKPTNISFGTEKYRYRPGKYR